MTVEACFSQMGGNFEEAMERMGKELRIVKYLMKFLSDECYTNLVEAMNKGDYMEAFAYAHNLKGLCMNLALSKLEK